MNNKSYWRHLFIIMLPCWLLWQGLWHFSFLHVFNYGDIEIGIIIRLKLLVELLFFIYGGVSLPQKLDWQPHKILYSATLILSFLLIMFTLRALILV